MSKIYGFARCSLSEEKGQDLNRQIRELKAAGAEEIVAERVHGDARIKPQLDLLLETAEIGSTIICTEVSRLSRSTKQLCAIIEIIKQKRMRLQILGSITIDCRNEQIDPMSQAFIQMSAVLQNLSYLLSAQEYVVVCRMHGQKDDQSVDQEARQMMSQESF